MSEKSFERRFIDICNQKDVLALNMEVLSQPGFPDVLVCKDNETRFIELKEILNIHDQFVVKNCLQKAQLPFWKQYLETGNTNLYLVIHSTKKIYVMPIYYSTWKLIHDNGTIGKIRPYTCSLIRQAVEYILW